MRIGRKMLSCEIRALCVLCFLCASHYFRIGQLFVTTLEPDSLMLMLQ